MEARLRSTGRPSLVVHTTLPQDGGPLQGAGPGGRPPRKALPHAVAKPFIQSYG